MKKVLVTGADGFIGSHLVEKLVDEGYSVKALSYYNSFNSWGWLDKIDKEILKHVEVVSGDVRDFNGMRKLVETCDTVFHLAALIGIPYSYSSPDMYVDTNIKGTLNILQACRDSSIERLLVTSTSEVYGSAIYTPIDEKHPLQGQSPYSATKIAADKLAESFYKSFDLPVTTVRPFNTYGPRQSARAIIPTIISQILAGNKKIKLGNLDASRDFNYVKDTVNGFLEISKSDKTIGKEINICSSKEITIGELFDKILKLTNANVEIELDNTRVRPKKSEVNRLLGSNKLITNLTNWHQEYNFEKGLLETIEWIRNNMNYFKSDLYNI